MRLITRVFKIILFMKSGGSLSDLLRKVDVPIISDADCDAQNGAGSVDGPTMICAALPEG